MSQRPSNPIHVLHVDDEPDLADTVGLFLQREDDRIEITTAQNARDGLAVLADADVDCVVSDYDMPDEDGLEFLEQVRDVDPDLPFVLFTGKGSEELASEAISAGVSDYLQKGGTERYALLARRITNLVEKHRSQRAVEAEHQRFQLLVEEATDVIFVVSPDGSFEYVTPSAESILGQTPEELVGTNGFDGIHPADRPAVMEQFAALVEDSDGSQTVEFRYEGVKGGGSGWKPGGEICSMPRSSTVSSCTHGISATGGAAVGNDRKKLAGST